jgi:hypothetical protein
MQLPKKLLKAQEGRVSPCAFVTSVSWTSRSALCSPIDRPQRHSQIVRAIQRHRSQDHTIRLTSPLGHVPMTTSKSEPLLDVLGRQKRVGKMFEGKCPELIWREKSKLRVRVRIRAMVSNPRVATRSCAPRSRRRTTSSFYSLQDRPPLVRFIKMASVLCIPFAQ